MKFHGLIAAILIGLLLGGCSEEKPVVEEPQLSEENRQALGKPPEFSVSISGNEFPAVWDKYCWEDDEKTCSLQPHPPEEVIKVYNSTSNPKAKLGEEISFHLNTPPESPLFKQPYSIEIIQFYENEEINVEIIDKKMLAPIEKGKSYYSAILRWDGDLKGEAIYAFSLMVR